MNHKVVFSPEAVADLIGLYDYIADRSGPDRALAYVERIERFCGRLTVAPLRGTRHDHIRAGLRTVGFERRATIAFHVDTETITVDRILYGGRDLRRAIR